MGQQNTVPPKPIVPGINSHPRALHPPFARRPTAPSVVPGETTTTRASPVSTTASTTTPCEFRVPSVPYANARVEVNSPVETTCSIRLPAGSRGLVLEDIFIYRDKQGRFVVTSGDRKALDEKLARLPTNNTNTNPVSSSASVVASVRSRMVMGSLKMVGLCLGALASVGAVAVYWA